MLTPIECELQGECSGCTWLGTNYEIQIQKKIDEIKSQFNSHGLTLPPDIRVKSIDFGRLRDRSDLTLTSSDGRNLIGLYDFEGSQIVDMKECPQMSEKLEKWLLEFRKSLLKMPKIKKGSARLRVSPSGERGLWLDLANVDVKMLLDEGHWLKSLLPLAFIEIGQKRKQLVEMPEGLKLRDPVLKPWFETYLGDEETPSPLFCHVGSFTQPGFRANQALISELKSVIKKISASNWLELFSGVGNFTLPLASWGKTVTTFELDSSAIEGFEKSLNVVPNLLTQITPRRGDAYHKASLPDFSKHDALLVDPPRSGLKVVVDKLVEISASQRPREIIYVSCFGPTLASDGAKLKDIGYELMTLQGVDQFPQSPHCEWIAHFQRPQLV